MFFQIELFIYNKSNKNNDMDIIFIQKQIIYI